MSDKPATFKIGETTRELDRASGFYFDTRTPSDVRKAIASAHRSGQRVRLFFGDRETGRAWAEESDVLGTIGASMGGCRVPLLIRDARSIGGGAILDSCIVAMFDCTTGRTLYKHAAFSVGAWAVVASDLPSYAEAVTLDGEIHARFKKRGQAARFVAFMT